MAVQFWGGSPLLVGGAVAMDPNCCCVPPVVPTCGFCTRAPDEWTIDLTPIAFGDKYCTGCDSLNAEWTLPYTGTSLAFPFSCMYSIPRTKFCAFNSPLYGPGFSYFSASLIMYPFGTYAEYILMSASFGSFIMEAGTYSWDVQYTASLPGTLVDCVDGFNEPSQTFGYLHRSSYYHQGPLPGYTMDNATGCIAANPFPETIKFWNEFGAP